jgi:alpha-D-xyloside xylohydrolase
MKNIISLFLTIFLFTSCSEKKWEKSATGVIIRLQDRTGKGARLVSLEPVSDHIIRVVASPEKTFSTAKSLCVYSQPELSKAFDISESGDSVIITTREIKASASLTTGAVTFRDKNDKTLLRESDKGGKSFSPVSVEGTDGYSLHQIFASPADEAFYGLGQHQSDEFNYKGLNESLYQYNTKVSVHFVISNSNYGILWDNYSLTKFGDPRDYSQIDLFRLYDDQGKGGALTVTYADIGTSRISHREREANIDFENIETVKKFPADLRPEGTEVVWSGELEPSQSGFYHFKLYYAGYTKLYIDNELVVSERWRTAWNPNTYKFSKELEKGRKYSIRLEWKPDGGLSYIGLKALSPRSLEEQGSLSLFSEMGDQIEYYFIKGNNIDEVISGYRTLTGKAPIMPLWSLGYWQSRERYKSQDELLDVVREYRKMKIPLDNIVLDWS